MVRQHGNLKDMCTSETLFSDAEGRQGKTFRTILYECVVNVKMLSSRGASIIKHEVHLMKLLKSEEFNARHFFN